MPLAASVTEMVDECVAGARRPTRAVGVATGAVAPTTQRRGSCLRLRARCGLLDRHGRRSPRAGAAFGGRAADTDEQFAGGGQVVGSEVVDGAGGSSRVVHRWGRLEASDHESDDSVVVGGDEDVGVVVFEQLVEEVACTFSAPGDAARTGAGSAPDVRVGRQRSRPSRPRRRALLDGSGSQFRCWHLTPPGCRRPDSGPASARHQLPPQARPNRQVTHLALGGNGLPNRSRSRALTPAKARDDRIGADEANVTHEGRERTELLGGVSRRRRWQVRLRPLRCSVQRLGGSTFQPCHKLPLLVPPGPRLV